ncbi:unnamed protein product [Arabidopsis thaliana]|uniref:Uncharacterized protein n=1 Tax=Arabidopsis thaliana TaxID=3702 RepID=A0A5S9Y939_ARATH|nr:unnamed protein product [Arabidopsis thaliana]
MASRVHAARVAHHDEEHELVVLVWGEGFGSNTPPHFVSLTSFDSSDISSYSSMSQLTLPGLKLQGHFLCITLQAPILLNALRENQAMREVNVLLARKGNKVT